MHYFGTDGIRGHFGEPPITVEAVRKLGQALAAFAQIQANGQRPALVIARDTRASGTILEEALIAGLRTQPIHIIQFGIAPTPTVALWLKHHPCTLGVMLTASHNPACDNGLKIFQKPGLKLTSEAEIALETLWSKETTLKSPHPQSSVEAQDGAAFYRQQWASFLPANSLSNWKIVLDAAHGAAVATSAAVLTAFGAQIIPLGDHPTGQNINHGVGSEHPTALCEYVQKHRAQLGIAHDGDGDRAVFCDENGRLLDGDEILGFLAYHALQAQTLSHNLLVATVQSNLGLDHALAQAGGQVLRVPVGDRHVLQAMLEHGATLGGGIFGPFPFPQPC